ncbi:programmed cell death protein 2-like [Cryptosporidium felis]|nr:programmed cell death protein 2-like [Cryptosporidium felis]
MQEIILGYFGQKINYSNEKEDSGEINSKFGGIPDFVDDERGTNCVGCKTPLKFILQLNTPYSKSKKRILYLFFCNNCDCEEAWRILRYSTETKQIKLNNYLSNQDEPKISDDWLQTAGVNTLFTMNDQEHNAQKTKTTNRILPFESTSYAMNYISESHLIDSDGKIKELFNSYLSEQGIDDESILLNIPSESNISSDISDEDFDTLETEENLYFPDRNKYLHHFSQKISMFPKQIVRYCFGGTPLFSESMKMDIQNCSICGSTRVFEFQVMSTLVYEWGRLFGENDMTFKFKKDWSTIIIFTCSNDCNAKLADESIVVQYF